MTNAVKWLYHCLNLLDSVNHLILNRLKMSKGECIFKRAVMENDKYKSWLKPETTVYSAKYSVCLSEFNVAWGSESAVRSHEHGNTHLRNITDLESTRKRLVPLFSWNTQVHSDSSSSSASGTCEKFVTPSPSSQSTAVDELVSQRASLTRAEIIWVSRLVKIHYTLTRV